MTSQTNGDFLIHIGQDTLVFSLFNVDLMLILFRCVLGGELDRTITITNQTNKNKKTKNEQRENTHKVAGTMSLIPVQSAA